MELTYYGHATFLLTSGDGTRILIDPFNAECGYPIPTVEPTAVTISHEHFDHNNLQMAHGSPKVIRGLAREGKEWAQVSERVGEVLITTVPTFHDGSRGSQRGHNTVFIYDVDGMRVVHLGDLGHQLDEGQADKIGQPDVLMIPVGGHYTIDASGADAVIESLGARIVIPMHYKTKVNQDWPITTVDEFVKGKPRVERQGSSVTMRAGDLPQEQTIWVLSPQGV